MVRLEIEGLVEVKEVVGFKIMVLCHITCACGGDGFGATGGAPICL